MKKTIQKHWWKILLILVVPPVVALLVLLLAFEISGEGWITYVAGVLTYLGAAILGSLAFWQNEKAFKLSNNSQQVSERSLRLAEMPYLSFMDVFNLKTEIVAKENAINPKASAFLLLSEENTKKQLRITAQFANLSVYPIASVRIASNNLGVGESNKVCRVNAAQQPTDAVIAVSMTEQLLKLYEEGSRWIALRFYVTNILGYITEGTLVFKKNEVAFYKIKQVLDINKDTAQEKTMRCSVCSLELGENDIYCPACGGKPIRKV